MCFPGSSAGKESTRNVGDPGWIPGLGRSPGEGRSYPLQYSWASLVAQLVKDPPAMTETWVLYLGWEDPLEKRKATHSSILAGECHGLYSPWGLKESDTTEQLSLITFFFFLSRKWQLTPLFLPGKSHGQRSLAGYSSWGCKSRTRLRAWTTMLTDVSSVESFVLVKLVSWNWVSLPWASVETAGYLVSRL